MEIRRDEFKSFAERLFAAQQQGCVGLPSVRKSRDFLDRLLTVLFPHFSGRRFVSQKEIECELAVIKAELTELLTPIAAATAPGAEAAAANFFSRLETIYDLLRQDAEAIWAGDPAARSVDEVILAYPGFFAICAYRVAHEFYLQQLPIFARILTEYAHRLTGIDIHPGATIGSSFCIDHGTGIVIGETTEIAAHVKLYQGVTLGALSVQKAEAERKRHPTIEANVVIYAGATILGGETVIGHDSIIGGSVWLTASVPPHARVYHKGDVVIREA